MIVSLPEVLTIQETSTYLRIPLRTMYKLAQEGKVPCQKVGKHWRFHRLSLEKWLTAYNAEQAAASRADYVPLEMRS